MPTPTPSRRKRRRALELLEASLDGCTEAIMLAHGFKIELLVELVQAGLATTSTERMLASGRPDGGHPPADHGRRPAGAGAVSMALILKRASALAPDAYEVPALPTPHLVEMRRLFMRTTSR
jgi:hypothetical protein